MLDIQQKEPREALGLRSTAPPSFFRRLQGYLIRLLRAWVFTAPPQQTVALPSPVSEAQTALEPIPEAQAEIEIATEPPVESLVDFTRIPVLHFRRRVLDWRDATHARLYALADALHQNFLQHLDREYEEMPFFRRLITKTANEVMQDHFAREVRWPFTGSLKPHELTLLECAGDPTLFGKFELFFNQQALVIDCSCLQEIEFTPSNRESIQARVRDLIFGRLGYVGRACEQASELAQKVLDRNAHAQQRPL